MIALALFAIFLTAVGLALLTSHKGAIATTDRIHAIGLTETALEGTRGIRDRSFTELTTGPHGVRVGSGSLGMRWMFDGTSVRTVDGFSTSVTIESLSSSRVRATAATTWNHALGRSGSVVLATELHDWQSTKAIGSWTSPRLAGQYVASGTPLFNDVAVFGTYVFVSSETSSGGRGLYVFDVSNPASPTRIATAFDLGAAGGDMVIYGTTLYILTDSITQEIRAYDITSPTTFSSAALVATYNLAGSSRGRSLALSATTLLVGAAQDATEQELYTFDVSVPSAITLLGSTDDTGVVQAIAARGSYAYIASGVDTSELRVASIVSPASPQMPSGSGANLTDVLDGQAIAVTGTAAVLGRALGAAIDELAYYPLPVVSAMPSTPPGPWTLDTGGAVNGIEIDPGGRYAFAASNGTTKQLRVLDLRTWKTGTAERGYYTVASGNGRGLAYDAWNDRVYLVTNTGLLVILPS